MGWLFRYVSRPADDTPTTWRTWVALVALFLALGLVEGAQ
jgi:hypothetical protein